MHIHMQKLVSVDAPSVSVMLDTESLLSNFTNGDEASFLLLPIHVQEGTFFLYAFVCGCTGFVFPHILRCVWAFVCGVGVHV